MLSVTVSGEVVATAGCGFPRRRVSTSDWPTYTNPLDSARVIGSGAAALMTLVGDVEPEVYIVAPVPLGVKVTVHDADTLDAVN